MPAFSTLDDLSPEQRVLVRLDLNSPVENGRVQDNRRFERHAGTVRELVEAGHRVVCMAHQGRPGGDTFLSLSQHADILGTHTGQDVRFVADTFGEDAIAAIRDLEGGEVLLLENVRMCDEELPEEPPEVKAETEFVGTLAPEFDAYVNDAYSVAHRSHASIVGFPLVLPAVAGRVMETEYEANTAIAAREFDGRVTMVVGGTKATDVIDVMSHLGDTVDDFLLGGVAGQLFLHALGYPVGFDSDPDVDLFDSQWEQNHELIEEIIDERGDQVTLAVDLAYEDGDGQRAEIDVEDIRERDVEEIDIDTETTEDVADFVGADEREDDLGDVDPEDIEESPLAFLDVGTDTAEQFTDIVRDSEAVFLKGALGVFEDERFSVGTVTVLRAIAETDCFSVVGGGDTSRAIGMYGMSEADFGHVSIAGGAYIRALTGDELVGIDVLRGGA